MVPPVFTEDYGHPLQHSLESFVELRHSAVQKQDDGRSCWRGSPSFLLSVPFLQCSYLQTQEYQPPDIFERFNCNSCNGFFPPWNCKKIAKKIFYFNVGAPPKPSTNPIGSFLGARVHVVPNLKAAAAIFCIGVVTDQNIGKWGWAKNRAPNNHNPEICGGRGDSALTEESKSSTASSHESLMVTEEDLHRFQSSCGLTQIVNPRPSNLLLYKLSAAECVRKGNTFSAAWWTSKNKKPLFWELF